MTLEEPLTEEEGLYLVKLKEEWLRASRKQRRVLRRRIRYQLFRIREGWEGTFPGLKKLMESQFTSLMTWDNFTFEWDVGADDPLLIVTPYTWTESGGTFEQINAVGPDGRTGLVNICRPTAFTKQEK